MGKRTKRLPLSIGILYRILQKIYMRDARSAVGRLSVENGDGSVVRTSVPKSRIN